MGILAIVVNVLAICVAGSIGALFRKKIQVQDGRLMVQFCGLLALLLAAWGLVRSSLAPAGGRSEITGSFLVAFALICGTFLGYSVYWQNVLARFAIMLQSFFEKEELAAAAKKHNTKSPMTAKKARSVKPIAKEKEPDIEWLALRTGHRFAEGFVLATVFVCSGTLLTAGVVRGDLGMLYIKAGVDAVVIFVLSLVYGEGTTISVVPLVITDGLLYGGVNGGTRMLSSALLNIKVDRWESTNAKEITEAKLAEFTKAVEKNVSTWQTEVVAQVTVLAALILLAVGFTMAFEKKYKVAYLLPSYLVLFAYQWFMPLMEAAAKA